MSSLARRSRRGSRTCTPGRRSSSSAAIAALRAECDHRGVGREPGRSEQAVRTVDRPAPTWLAASWARAHPRTSTTVRGRCEVARAGDCADLEAVRGAVAIHRLRCDRTGRRGEPGRQAAPGGAASRISGAWGTLMNSALESTGRCSDSSSPDTLGSHITFSAGPTLSAGEGGAFPARGSKRLIPSTLSAPAPNFGSPKFSASGLRLRSPS